MPAMQRYRELQEEPSSGGGSFLLFGVGATIVLLALPVIGLLFI